MEEGSGIGSTTPTADGPVECDDCDGTGDKDQTRFTQQSLANLLGRQGITVNPLQIKVKNASPGRHSVLCNGARIPMVETGTEGEFVGAVRYKAWNPPSALHPTVGIHSPLVFDLFDGWSGRSVAGCRYHVAHPGGRNFEVFPVNAYEAEGRRLARFFRMGHTPGTLAVPPANIGLAGSREFPFTLDLRQRR